MKLLISICLILFSIQSNARPTPFPYYKCSSDLSMIKGNERIHDVIEVITGAVPYSHTLGPVLIPHNLDGKKINLYVQVDLMMNGSESAWYFTEDLSRSSEFELVKQQLPEIFKMSLFITTDDENIIGRLTCEIIADQ